ncbi:transmembrane protein 154 [Gadus chalcogrammus]|uniref:transmembrane protein 154 n=1 Tax=Gadus chalcogrammus TaxID=1042646 RepID=UPI0024C20ED8|nr:transmembrane protein 154 [Gadus chalcogrammus]
MSAFTAAYVRRGPREMRPVLLLLLLASLAGTGQFDDYSDASEGEEAEVTTTDQSFPASGESEDDQGPMITESSQDQTNDTWIPEDQEIGNSSDAAEPLEDGLSFTIILVPVVLVVVIIGMIVCGIAMSRKWNQKMTTSDKTNDSYMQASSTEKVPMPMFDDDIPSVLELEMEDMDQWVENNA